MKKSLTGTVDTTDTSILTVGSGRVACDVCLVLNNGHTAATTVSLSHRRGEAKALIKKTLLGQKGMDNASTLLPLTGVVFDEDDQLALDFSGPTGSIDYVVSYLEESHRSDTLMILELMSRKLLEGMAGKQIAFKASPVSMDPPMIMPTPTGQNTVSTDITADLKTGSSDNSTEPVVFPIAHAPGVADEQTYKLQAREGSTTGTHAVSVGTTLYVEEIGS